MNIEQQKQFKLSIIWAVFKPVLTAILALLGDEAMEWIKGKVDEVKGDSEVFTTQGAGDTCLGVKKPTTPPDGVGPNGHYACRTTGWVWVEDIG